MLIKRVTAPTRQEALEKIRQELGPDVEIIHAGPHKRRGFLAWFRPPWFEVVAVRPDPISGDASVRVDPRVRAAVDLASSGMAELPPPAAPAAPAPPQPDIRAVSEELQEIKKQLSMLSELKTTLTALAAQPKPEEPVAVPTIIVHPASAPARDTEYVDAALKTLERNELTAELIAEIRRYLLEALGERELKQPKIIRDKTCEYLASRLGASRGLEIPQGQKGKLVALVGPTGVGKTTTLAKLAGGLMFNQKLDVAFITIDTYRIAAPEQLRKYAEIVEVPVKVVFRPDEMIELVNGFRGKDVILIDTVGRSPRNREDLLDLRKFLEFGLPVETHLLCSAMTKLSDLRAIVDGFKDLNFQRLLVTKTDETATFGSILSLLVETKLSASFLTTGQCVPDDILEATPQRLASLAFSRRALVQEPPHLAASDGAEAGQIAL